MVKNGRGQSGFGTLKLTYLKTEQRKEPDFLHGITNAEGFKLIQSFFSV